MKPHITTAQRHGQRGDQTLFSWFAETGVKRLLKQLCQKNVKNIKNIVAPVFIDVTYTIHRTGAAKRQLTNGG
jgi:hypothetical protein